MLLKIQAALLIKLIKLVTEVGSSPHPTNLPLTLTASRDRLCVRQGRFAAETEAVILSDGQCTFSCRKLLHALVDSRAEENLSVQADERHLWVGRFRLPVLSYSADAPALEDFQVFMASQNGFIAPAAV